VITSQNSPIGYDTQALGLMAVAVALASVNVALMSELGVLWWLPLAGLAMSLAIGVVAISQPEIETGQNLSLAWAARMRPKYKPPL
jgi:hypothetical protein